MSPLKRGINLRPHVSRYRMPYRTNLLFFNVVPLRAEPVLNKLTHANGTRISNDYVIFFDCYFGCNFLLNCGVSEGTPISYGRITADDNSIIAFDAYD